MDYLDCGKNFGLKPFFPFLFFFLFGGCCLSGGGERERRRVRRNNRETFKEKNKETNRDGG